MCAERTEQYEAKTKKNIIWQKKKKHKQNVIFYDDSDETHNFLMRV